MYSNNTLSLHLYGTGCPTHWGTHRLGLHIYAAFYVPPISTQKGNRGLPELISLMNTQSFVEHHTASPAV